MSEPAGAAKTIRFCKTCEKETIHEIRRVSSGTERICLACLERAELYTEIRE